ncbi:MAG: hypothetical protein KUG74_05245 [Rhodobacteraceae bacterium]|nr:hypothetical protein [Paracoccaceae bacterium]
MQTITMSRKDRRRREAKAAKLYGVSGEKALIVHQAYNALFHKQLEKVVELIGPISRSDPTNKHPWIILGGTALEKIEGKTAKVFFEQAHAIAPNDPVVLGGMAKAHVLEAEVEPATLLMEKAFAAGNDDKGLVNLYIELMARLGRSLKAVDVVSRVVGKLNDAGLSYRLAIVLTDADETNAAAFWFHRAYQLEPEKEEHQIGRLRGLMFSRKFEEVEKEAPSLLETVKNRDEVMTIYLMALRLLGKYDIVTDYCDTFEFSDIKAFALARGLMANVYQDLGQWDRAEPAYLEAMHIAGEPGKISKALGVYKYREREIGDGFRYYSDRFPAQNRKHIPLENAAPENLKNLSRIHLMGEQGIGDQLALLSLLRTAPIDLEKTEVIYVSDERFDPVLQNNLLSIDFLSQDRFFNEPRSLQSNELVYLGDLSQYLDNTDPATIQGAYLVANENRVAHLKKKYQEMASGRPIVGVAWNSASLIGHMRSLPLTEILTTIQQEALVINLQYNASAAEIQAASKIRPDLEFFDDKEVNQMTDLGGFVAQIATLDRVVTIDNTTAHFCGALGHPDTHVLIPIGSECMWYWGRNGGLDPWYGNLHLHRQTQLRDWAKPIESVRQYSYDS